MIIRDIIHSTEIIITEVVVDVVNPSWWIVFTGAVFSLIGVIIAFVVSAREKKARLRFKDHAMVYGKLVDFVRRVDTSTLNTEISYSAVFEYRVNGLDYSVTSVEHMSAQSYHGKKIGDTESVFYNDENPVDAVIEREISGGESLAWVALTFAVIGMVFIVGGLFV